MSAPQATPAHGSVAGAHEAWQVAPLGQAPAAVHGSAWHRPPRQRNPFVQVESPVHGGDGAGVMSPGAWATAASGAGDTFPWS
jgi:hypothetical protein